MLWRFAYIGLRLLKHVVLSKSTKKIFNYSFGSLLFLWLCYSLYIQLTSQDNLHFSIEQVRQSLYKNWPTIALVVVLMLVNWGIEARKWQLLVRPFEPLSYRKAWYSILAGVSISIITPNRIGEYGGRVLFLKSGNRLRGASVTGVGSLSQFMTTMLFGLIGCIYFISHFGTVISGKYGLLWEWAFLSVVLLLFVAALLLYFHLDKLTGVFKKIKWLNRFQYFVKVINTFTDRRLLQILGLSIMRYLIFSAQYLILLEVFGADIWWVQGFLMLFIIYVCMALIPSIAIAELGIRGELSIWILGLVSSNQVAILAATLGIWLINLLIPAIMGSILLPGIKVLNEEERKAGPPVKLK